MKNKRLRGLSASKAWFLISAALSGLARSNGQELYAFEMLEDEEAMPPYEIMPAENVTSYQVTSFQEVDADGAITGVGVLAFTLYDIVHTQERLLCEEEACCEARNYSYEDIDLTGEQDYFPPCSINELVEILQQNCSFIPFVQTIPNEVFTKNVSNMCGYYTLYNQSNVSHTLLDCVQNVFDQRWPGYCKENEQDLVASGLSFGSAFVFAGILLLSSTGKSLKGVYSEILGSQIACTILLSIFLAVAEYAVFFYSLLGQGYIVPSILREHHFSSKSISRVSDLPEALIMLFLNYFMMHLLISFSSSIQVEKKFLRLARVIFSSIVNDIFYGFTFVSL